jgi:outer membrane biosynthesis protein TonB
MLYDAGLPVENINEVCEQMKETYKLLNEGRFPERQAWNKEGKLITFQDVKRKQDAIRSGNYFERNPRGGVPERKPLNVKKIVKGVKPKHLTNKQLAPSKYIKNPPPAQPKPIKYNPPVTKDSPIPQSPKKKIVPIKKIKTKQVKQLPKQNKPMEKEMPVSHTPPPSTAKPAEEKPTNNMWKFDPAATYKKAKDLGWERDNCGNWWYHGKFVAMTTKKGFVMPVANGDKAESADWPEYGNIPLPPGAQVTPDQPGE